MAIDIRATVTCSLGEVISASVSDTAVAGVGVIKTTGSCVVKGIISPAPGTSVTFTYTKNSQTYTIPRSLLVLSSYTDPFRRVTQVNLGCALKYKEDQQEYETLEALNDPANSGYTQADTQIITVPVTANTIFLTCLNRLGISYPNSGPGNWISNPVLTNTFSIKQFDFRKSYVGIMDALLVSESKCGYVLNNTFQIFSLNEEPGVAPVLDLNNIIDIAPSGNATPPADIVLVNYSSLKLKQPDSSNSGGNLSQSQFGDFKRYYDDQWEKNISESPIVEYPIAYQIFSGGTVTEGVKTYSGRSITTNTTYYKSQAVLNGKDERGRPIYENKEIVDRRESITEEPYAKIAGKYLSAVLSYNSIIGNTSDPLQANGDATVITQKTVETFEYDKEGNEIVSTIKRYEPRSAIGYSKDLPVYIRNSPSEFDFLDLSNTLVEVERTIKTTDKQATQTRIVTTSYGLWADTPSGTQAIAEAKDKLMTIEQVKALIDKLEGLIYLGDSISTSSISPTRSLAQSRPSKADIINQRYSDGGSAVSNWKTEEETEYAIAINGSASGIRTVLNLPYAPDDRFIKSGSSYSSVRSDAPLKALTYARVQNSMTTGSAYGVQLQTRPELMPDRPFKEIVIQANGLSALYKTDSISWSMDSSSVVASFAGLFYGAIGGTGDFWFPVASGITTLPETPPVTDGEMIIPAVVPLGNEIIKFKSTVKTNFRLKVYNYNLQLPEVSNTIKVFTKITAQASGVYRIIAIPTSEVLVSVATPKIDVPVYVLAQSANLSVGVNIPTIRASVGDVYAVLTEISIVAQVPVIRAFTGQIQLNAATQINIVANTPDVRAGLAIVKPGVLNIISSIDSIVAASGSTVLVQDEILVLVETGLVIVTGGAAVLPDTADVSFNAGETITRRYNDVYEDIVTNWSYRGYLNSDIIVDHITGSIVIATGTAILMSTAKLQTLVTGYDPGVILYQGSEYNYMLGEIFVDLPIVPSFDSVPLIYGAGLTIPAPTIVKIKIIEVGACQIGVAAPVSVISTGVVISVNTTYLLISGSSDSVPGNFILDDVFEGIPLALTIDSYLLVYEDRTIAFLAPLVPVIATGNSIEHITAIVQLELLELRIRANPRIMVNSVNVIVSISPPVIVTGAVAVTNAAPVIAISFESQIVSSGASINVSNTSITVYANSPEGVGRLAWSRASALNVSITTSLPTINEFSENRYYSDIIIQQYYIDSQNMTEWWGY